MLPCVERFVQGVGPADGPDFFEDDGDVGEQVAVSSKQMGKFCVANIVCLVDAMLGGGIPACLEQHTANTVEDLNVYVAARAQAAIQANCETRLLAGQQAKVFTAAALSLCHHV